MDMRFVHVFEGAAREKFMIHTNRGMNFKEMADALVDHYHYASSRLKLRVRSDGTSITLYIKPNNITDLHEGLKG